MTEGRILAGDNLTNYNGTPIGRVCGVDPTRTMMECAPPVPGIGNDQRCGICGKDIPQGQEWWQKENLK